MPSQPSSPEPELVASRASVQGSAQVPPLAPAAKPVKLWCLFLLVLLPAALRLAPIQHGKPDNYLPDTHIVRNALGMAKDKTPVPPAGQYSTYPYLLSYALLPVYATQFGLGKVQGDWDNATEYSEVVMEDPWRVHLPARILFAWIAAFAPLLVFLGLRNCGLSTGAFAGWFFMATCLLHVHHSVQERPWAPLITVLLGCAWSCTAYVNSGRAKHLVLAGIWAGLAVATHQGGLAAVCMPAIAWLLSPAGLSGRRMKPALQVGFACAGAFLVVALLLGHPYYLVHGPPSGDAVVMEDQIEGTSHFTLGGQSTVFGFRLATLQRLSRVFVGYDAAIVLLGLAGIWLALRCRPARPLMIFALLWGAYFMTNVNDHPRYLLPLAAGLVYAVGFVCEKAWPIRWARGVVIGFACFALVQTVRFAWVMNQPDTRQQMQEQLLAWPSPIDVAVANGGPNLPLDLPSLERLQQYRELYRREEFRAQRLTKRDSTAQIGALPLEAIVALDRRHHATWLRPKAEVRFGQDLAQALDGLGITHVLLADHDPMDPRSPLLLDDEPADSPSGPLQRSPAGPTGPLPKLDPLPLAAPILEILPGGSSGGSARLPWVMEFPMTDLWTVSRPGPLLRLYEWRP